MDSSLLGGLALAVLVLIVGFALRRTSGTDAATAARAEDSVSEGASPAAEAAPKDSVAALLDEVSENTDDLGPDDDAVVAMTSDGAALVADRHAVRLVPPESDEEAAWRAAQDPAARARDRRGDYAINSSWHAGDLTGVRVQRGDANEAPWRLDGLGRDGEYTVLLFETESGARAAHDLFVSQGIVRAGRDDDGESVPPSAEQFDKARRIYLETIAELEAGDGGDSER